MITKVGVRGRGGRGLEPHVLAGISKEHPAISRGHEEEEKSVRQEARGLRGGGGSPSSRTEELEEEEEEEEEDGGAGGGEEGAQSLRMEEASLVTIAR
eukprot:1106306-Rhodomonas_salina.1